MTVRLLILLFLVFSSCSQKKETLSGHIQLSEKKLYLTVAPVIDNSKHKLSWNISKEIRTELQEALLRHNHYLITTKDKTKNKQNNFFDPNLSWIREAFPNSNLVLFTQILEHSEKPSYTAEEISISDSPTDLSIIVRIRLVDLREENPHILLEQTFEKKQHIPRPFTCFNFTQVAWGQPMYTFSPLGVIHAALIDEIVELVENYIFK